MQHFMLVISLSLLFSGRAHAQEAAQPRLSDRGRTLLAGGISGYWANDRNLARRAATEWSVDVAPSVAYFVWQRVALGAYGSYGRTQERLFSTPAYYGLGPQSYSPSVTAPDAVRVTAAITKVHRLAAGLQGIAELVLAPRLGLFVWITAGYAHERRRLEVPGAPSFASNIQGASTQQRVPSAVFGDDLSEHAVEASLFVPLTFHLSGSVALGVGPYARWRSYFKGADANIVRIGASSWVGASF